MKFKIGQKVRVKDWLDMPQDMIDKWGINNYVGEAGFVRQENLIADDIGYDIDIKRVKGLVFCLERELESVIKVGEQLVFPFMNKE